MQTARSFAVSANGKTCCRSTGVILPLTSHSAPLIWAEESMVDCELTLTNILRKFHMQVAARLPEAGKEAIHPFNPGDFVFVKSLDKVFLSSRYKGSYQVLLTTRTVLKVEGKPEWIHASRCRRVSSTQPCSSSLPQTELPSSSRMMTWEDHMITKAQWTMTTGEDVPTHTNQSARTSAALRDKTILTQVTEARYWTSEDNNYYVSANPAL